MSDPDGPDGTEGQTTTRDCGREANPHYGIADRIALALFPFLDAAADNNKEAGE